METFERRRRHACQCVFTCELCCVTYATNVETTLHTVVFRCWTNQKRPMHVANRHVSKQLTFILPKEKGAPLFQIFVRLLLLTKFVTVRQKGLQVEMAREVIGFCRSTTHLLLIFRLIFGNNCKMGIAEHNFFSNSMIYFIML